MICSYRNCIELTATCQLIFSVPSEPQLEMVSVNSSSVTLHWSPPGTPNGVITQYSIQLDGTDIDDLNGSVRMYTIGQLPSDTVYVLQLTASTSVGEGLPSSVTVITCKLFNTVAHQEIFSVAPTI